MKIYLTTIKNKKTKKFLNSIDRPILQAKMRRKDDIYLIDDIIHKAILHLNYGKPVCIKTDKQKVLFYFDKIKI